VIEGRATAVDGCIDSRESWEGRPVAALCAEWGVPRVVVCGSAASTNDVAYGLASAGTADGTCVLADAQTAGRGREGRTWHSRSGLGIWTSLVLRPRAGIDAGVLPLCIGIALAGAIERFCGALAPAVKWPNDVLVGGRKVAGILCEACWSGERLAFFVAGIGLNVNHRAHDFPPDLRQSATSLRLAATRPVSRAEVAGRLVRAVRSATDDPRQAADALAGFHRVDALRGRSVSVTDRVGGVRTGIADGIEPDGALRIRTPSGAVERIRTGTVRLLDQG
jgi:BirA family transcriptional regulator, biotin operon repressor / biotin---[acetyl-CoA-carboxylase] ligase